MTKFRVYYFGVLEKYLNTCGTKNRFKYLVLEVLCPTLSCSNSKQKKTCKMMTEKLKN